MRTQSLSCTQFILCHTQGKPASCCSSIGNDEWTWICSGLYIEKLAQQNSFVNWWLIFGESWASKRSNWNCVSLNGEAGWEFFLQTCSVNSVFCTPPPSRGKKIPFCISFTFICIAFLIISEIAYNYVLLNITQRFLCTQQFLPCQDVIISRWLLYCSIKKLYMDNCSGRHYRSMAHG